jgi:transposase
MIERLCGSERVSACELSRQVGVSQTTLSRWLRQAKVGAMRDETKQEESKKAKRPRRPRDWSAEERFEAVAEAAKLSEEELGAFLRREGLRMADLEHWRESMLEAVRPQAARRAKRRRSRQTKRIRELEKELNRKDKALAETAALLALKKKVQQIWGDGEDDTR